MLNLILFGPPGCGKGTQSALIANRYNLVHLSTGELFREEFRKGTKLGKDVIHFMKNGLLIPDPIVLKKLYRVASQYDSATGLVFDGFPRTLNQAVVLDKMLEKKGIPVSIVFCMVVDEEELINRMLNRAEDSGRMDDNEEIIHKRMEIYRKHTRVLKDYYEKQDKVSYISGMAPVKVVSERIAQVVDYFRKTNKILSHIGLVQG